jgi:hypothetical protein
VEIARRAYVSRNPMLAGYESREAAGGAARYSSPTWGTAYREGVRPEGPPPKCYHTLTGNKAPWALNETAPRGAGGSVGGEGGDGVCRCGVVLMVCSARSNMQ